MNYARPVPPAEECRLHPKRYKHVEAFCLMWYRCERQNCGHMERIWNSRDGVTPFTTQCPSCGEASFTHAYFGSDLRAKGHRLHPFQKYWCDMTDADATAATDRYAERINERYPEKPLTPDAVQAIFDDIRRGPCLKCYLPGGVHP